MIFPVLNLESKIQVGEKTRISGVKSYKSQDEASFSLTRIKPSSSDSFIDVSALDASDNTAWYLDWQYSAAGTQTISLEITTDGAAVVVTGQIEVVTSAAEKLFSVDADIVTLEPDVIQYCRDGKNTLNDYHRQAQTAIIDDIYRSKILADDGSKLTVDEVIDVIELNFWSMYMVLTKVYQSMSNKTDDIFSVKSAYYAKKEEEARAKAMRQLHLDYDKNGIQDDAEKQDFSSVSVLDMSLK